MATNNQLPNDDVASELFSNKIAKESPLKDAAFNTPNSAAVAPTHTNKTLPWKMLLITAAVLVIAGLLSLLGWLYTSGKNQKQQSQANKFNTASLDLASLQSGSLGNNATVLINGALTVNGPVTAQSFSGNGANLSNVDATRLNHQPGSYYLDASNLDAGTLNDARLSGNVVLLGSSPYFTNLLVTGTTTLQGPATLQSTLNATGAVTFQSTLDVSGNGSVGGDLTVTGDTNINGLTYNWPGTQANGVLSNDGAGNLAWQPVGACASCITNGGNAFGSSLSVGTNDANNLILKTNGADQVTINTTGDVGIGLNPGYKLDVNGDVNVAAGNAFRIGGTAICTSGGCAASAGSTDYVQNSASLQTGVNFNFEIASINSVGGIIRAKAGQISDLQQWQNSGGVAVAAVDASGHFVATTLGATDTATYLCRNSSNQIAACSGSGGGAAFVQGGNSFGATANLGTNDNNALAFVTNGTEKMRLTTGGALLWSDNTGTIYMPYGTTTNTIDSSGIDLLANPGPATSYQEAFIQPGLAYIITASTGTSSLAIKKSPNLFDSFNIDPNGVITFGSGSGATLDTNLYRSAANLLKTDDSFAVGTLGAADTSAYLCLNSSNILAACSGSASGAAFVQGGNSFGATANLGTNDNNLLAFRTNGTEQMRLTTGGVLEVNSTGTPGTVEKFRVGTPTTVDNLANVIFTASATTSKPLVVQGIASQTADLQEWQNSAGTVLAKVDSAGRGTFGGSGITGAGLTATGGSYAGISAAAYGGTAIYAAAASAASIGLRVQSLSTLYTGDLQRWEPGAVASSSVDHNGFFKIGATGTLSTVEKLRVTDPTTADTSANVMIATSATTSKGLVIQGAASQSADLQEWQASTGTVLAAISSGGVALLNRTSVSDVASSRLEIGGNVFIAPWNAIYSGADSNGNRTRAMLQPYNGADGKFYIQSYNGTVLTASGGASQIPLVVKGAASQTANLQEWQDSSGVVMDYVSAVGDVNINHTGNNFLNIQSSNSGSSNIQLGVSGTGPRISYDPVAGALQLYMSGTEKARLTSGGVLEVNSTGAPGTVEKFRVNTPTTVDNLANSIFSTSATTSKGLVIQGVASQTANLQEWQNSTGTTLLSVSSAGSIYSPTQPIKLGFNVAIQGEYSAGGSFVDMLYRGASNMVYVGSGGADSQITGANYTFLSSGGNRIVKSSGGFYPESGGTLSLGGSSNRWNTIMTRPISAASVAATFSGQTAQTGDLTQWTNSSDTVLTSITSSGALSFGSNSASVGNIRLPNATNIAWRNAANTADFTFGVNAGDVLTSNIVTLSIGTGGGGALSFNNGAKVIENTATGVLRFGEGFTSNAQFPNPVVVNQSGAITLGTVEKFRVTAPTTVDNSANVMIATTATTSKGLVIQGKASQTANLQEWQDSTGSAIAYVNATGSIVTSASTSNANILTLPTFKAINTHTSTGGVADYSFAAFVMSANNDAVKGEFFADGSGFFNNGTPDIYFRATTNHSMLFGTNSLVRMRITNGGVVTVADPVTSSSYGTVEKFRVNTPTTVDNSANTIFSTSATTSKGLVIQGVASQAANLQEWQNSNGTVLGSISAAGVATFSYPTATNGADALIVQSTVSAPAYGTAEMRFRNYYGTGQLYLNSSIGNGGNIISNGTMTIQAANNSSGIRLATDVTATNGAEIHLGSTNGTKQHTANSVTVASFDSTFNPTSGTGIMHYLDVIPTINQTGGANGITRGIYINPTLTAAADWRSIEIANNSGKAIWQTGASATNYFAGAVTTSATPASTGSLRLGNTQTVGWRNAANSGDVTVGVNASDILQVTSPSADASTVAQFNNAGATNCTVQPGGTGFACSSDARLKTNIMNLDTTNASDLVNKLQGVSFNWITNPDGQTQVGFIAQDLMKYIPSAVSTDSTGHYVANYSMIIPYLVEAFKKQQTEIDTLKSTSAGTSIDVLKTLADAKAVTLSGDLTVGGNVVVSGRTETSSDNKGTVSIPAGQTSVTVSLPSAFSKKPNINLTPGDFIDGQYRVTGVSKTGFTIELQKAQTNAVNFDWQAL